MNSNKPIKDFSKMTESDLIRFMRPLKRTPALKKDLDKHLYELNVIPTTDKTELRNMVKK